MRPCLEQSLRVGERAWHGGGHPAMDLLERSSNLTELRELLHQAATGQGSLLLLGGEAGVGKTALVRRFCQDAPAVTRVVFGACDPLSTPRPLGPLLDMAALDVRL